MFGPNDGTMSDADRLGAGADLNKDDKQPAALQEKSRFSSDRLRHRLRNIGAAIASVAAIGAVIGGLTGYWNAWKVISNDLLQIRPQSEASGLHCSEHTARRLTPYTLRRNSGRQCIHAMKDAGVFTRP
jgi:hypothetical protein